jgi:hypothetical protein
MTMTVEQVKERRQQAEQAILTILQKLEQQTGCSAKVVVSDQTGVQKVHLELRL